MEEEEGAARSASTAAAAGTSGRSGSGSAEEQHPPTQRELDNLREWVLTQQWLRQQAMGTDVPGAGAAAGAAQQLQAMQQLWEQAGGRG